jgi:hypothetical protein
MRSNTETYIHHASLSKVIPDPKKVILIYERKIFFVHDPILKFERSIEVILPSHLL